MDVLVTALFGLALLSPYAPAVGHRTSLPAPLDLHWGAVGVAPVVGADSPGPVDGPPRATADPAQRPSANPTVAPDATQESTPDRDPGPEPAVPQVVGAEPPAEGVRAENSPTPPRGGEPSLDDIFGTAQTHTEVDVVSEAPPSDQAETSHAARPSSHAPAVVANDKLKTRVKIVSSVYYDTARVQQRGFGRNENRLEFYFAYTPNEHIQIVGDIEPVFFGVAQAQGLGDLASRQMLTPFHVESDAAYVAIHDLLPKLDIKIGRQTVIWGTADRFNPTNNINADDLEDRPLFTEPIANQMVVVDYAPLDDKLWFQGVYVPIFYPALLPPSAAAALKDPQTEVPFALPQDQQKIGELQNLLAISPMLVPEVFDRVKTPRPRFSNGQSAVKLGTSLGGVDLSVSYYNGRHDIPSPVLAESSTKDFAPGSSTSGCCFESRITLVYPRMQVIGADFTTQVPFLGDMGLWGEGALFIPQAQSLRIEFPIDVDVTPDDGITNPVPELSGPTVRGTPYVKATAGADYSFGKHVYVQAQYLRGFIDEFGADQIGNYVVGGADLIFFGRHLIFRAFAVADIPTGRADEGSYVLFPELIVVPPWGFVTFEVGSFFLLGGDRTKFGQRAAGSSIAFFKLAGTF